MMNTTKTLNDYLINNGLEVEVIYNDLFVNAAGDEIISRYDPSTAKVTEYIDGSSEGQIQIAYYVRSQKPSYCRSMLQQITKLLDNLEIVDAEDNATHYIINVSTLPSFVSIDDKNQSIYTIEVNCNYIHGE